MFAISSGSGNQSLQRRRIDQMARMGICHICGQYGKLTAEHVPPRKSFNDSKIFRGNISEFIGRSKFPWDTEGVRMTQSQRGVVYETLCQECNNNTGSWYGAAYVDFAWQGYKALKKNAHQSKEEIEINFSNVYPLRIIKQVLSMFCSINSEDFISNHLYLRKLILDKDQMGLNPERYKVFMYTPYASIGRYAGTTGVMRFRGDFFSTSVFSEMVVPPYGFILRLEGNEFEDLCDITFFANQYIYCDERDIHLTIPIREVHTYFPGDFRTREEVISDVIRNRLSELSEQ